MSAASARTQHAAKAVKHDGVPCPFCPLLCDDLSIDTRGTELRTSANACPRARAGFERPLRHLSPRINGRKASLEDAVAAAATILRRAQQPLYGGLGTDVDGMRGAFKLAERTRGYLDHMHGEAMAANYRVLQSRGWITTTLTEIRNRADLIVFAGTDASKFPRFYDRAVWPAQTLFNPKPAQRKLVYLGRGLKTKPAQSPMGYRPEHLKCDPAVLGEVTGAVNAVLREQPLQNPITGIKTGAIRQLAELFRNASYSVLVWSPSELPPASAELIIESFCNLVETINESSRGGGFILSGLDGGTTAGSVTAWLTGYPLRVGFARGYPEYDPVAFASERLLADKRADALLWLSSFNAQNKAPVTRLPSIVLSDDDRVCEREPEVFIPIGTPGVDHEGTLIRCDSVVSLPLQQLRDSNRPSAATVMAALLARI